MGKKFNKTMYMHFSNGTGMDLFTNLRELFNGRYEYGYSNEDNFQVFNFNCDKNINILSEDFNLYDFTDATISSLTLGQIIDNYGDYLRTTRLLQGQIHDNYDIMTKDIDIIKSMFTFYNKLSIMTGHILGYRSRYSGNFNAESYIDCEMDEPEWDFDDTSSVGEFDYTRFEKEHVTLKISTIFDGDEKDICYYDYYNEYNEYYNSIDYGGEYFNFSPTYYDEEYIRVSQLVGCFDMVNRLRGYREDLPCKLCLYDNDIPYMDYTVSVGDMIELLEEYINILIDKLSEDALSNISCYVGYVYDDFEDDDFEDDDFEDDDFDII